MGFCGNKNELREGLGRRQTCASLHLAGFLGDMVGDRRWRGKRHGRNGIEARQRCALGDRQREVRLLGLGDRWLGGLRGRRRRALVTGDRRCGYRGWGTGG